MSGEEKRSEEDELDEDDARESEERVAAYVRLGVPAATLAAAVVAGALQGPPAVVLVLAAGALVAVISIFWASVRTLVGETPLSGADAYALGAPRAAEEQKRAVLRALKDLEFERSVGKITAEDYDALVAKYRAEGKRLIRLLDEEGGPRRARVESLVRRRLEAAGLVPAAEGSALPEPPASASAAQQEAEPKASAACEACGTRNDPDALFCKKCGKKREAQGSEATAEVAERVTP